MGQVANPEPENRRHRFRGMTLKRRSSQIPSTSKFRKNFGVENLMIRSFTRSQSDSGEAWSRFGQNQPVGMSKQLRLPRNSHTKHKMTGMV